MMKNQGFTALLRHVLMGKSLQMTIMKGSLMLSIPLFFQSPNISLVTQHYGKIGQQNYYPTLSVGL